ncbi:hypothetical protein HK104_006873 [Borealophlyctis nickersoniae]|nr:hypothetical protein HK104_006873 [Borealophlyctis nickersoniae]
MPFKDLFKRKKRPHREEHAQNATPVVYTPQGLASTTQEQIDANSRLLSRLPDNPQMMRMSLPPASGTNSDGTTTSPTSRKDRLALLRKRVTHEDPGFPLLPPNTPTKFTFSEPVWDATARSELAFLDPTPRHERSRFKTLLETARTYWSRREQVCLNGGQTMLCVETGLWAPVNYEEKDVLRVLGGRLDDGDGGESVIQAERNEVRVFVSSTFTDTKHERNALMADVYPYLQKVADALHLELNTVDMRWGVREEASNTHSTTKYCLKELEKCFRLSAGPAFLCLLGDKYGYRPFPSSIPQPEFDSILSTVTDPTYITLLKTWFHLDTNAVPPTYELQHVGTVIPEFLSEDEEVRRKGSAEWWRVFGQLQMALREGVEKAGLEGEARDKYFVSVTEDEVVHAMQYDVEKDRAFYFQ